MARHDQRAYEIRVRGHLDGRWAAWFDGLEVRTQGDATTVIAGRFADQAALHGLLARIRDLGLELISISGSDDPSDQPAPNEGDSQ